MEINDKEELFQKEQEKYVKALKRKNNRYRCLAICSVLFFLIIWQLLDVCGILKASLPSPIEVIQAGITKIHSKVPDNNLLIDNIIASGKVALLGFTLSIIIGLPLGLFMGWFTPVDRFVSPIFEFLRPIPPISMIPIIVVLAGVNIKARALIIFFSTFVVVVLNSYSGMKQTSQTLINVAKTFGMGNVETFIKVGIPSAMPMAYTGIKLALSGAWSTLVAAEMLASNAGLGNMLNCARNTSKIDLVVFSMLLIGVVGALFTSIVSAVEKRNLKWKTGDRK